jgi:hypothetical protein
MTLDRIIARIFPSRKPAPPRPLDEKDIALDVLLAWCYDNATHPLS